MMAGRKVRLVPDKAQKQWLKENAGVARFIYNFALGYKIEQYENYNISVGQSEIRQEIINMKYSDDYSWLRNYSSVTIDQPIRDMLSAYKNFFRRGNKGFPKFKKKGRCKESFYVRYDELYSIDERHIKFPKLNKPIKISENCYIEKGSIKNPRVSFDGKYWYLSYSYECEPLKLDLTDDVLGIDLGIKKLAVCSSGVAYKNINKDANIKRLEERKRRLQRQISRSYIKNNYKKTNNIKKLEKKVRLIDRKLSNIRKTYIHQVTMQIVKTKPSTIVLEDLGISSMMKNRHLAKAIQDQLWYFFRKCIEYKSEFYGGIQVIIAPRTYASSKLCSNCKTKKKFLALSERVYRCECCGFICDRDLNAAYNLRDLAFSQ